MSTERHNNILKEINRSLSELNELYQNEDVLNKIYDSKSPDYHIWEYNIRNPKNDAKRHIYFIPQKEGLDNFAIRKYQNLNSNCYIINIFEESENKEFLVSTTEFYQYLFNLEGYNKFLKTDPDFRNVSMLYIDRNVTIDVDEDKLLLEQENKFQRLLNIWASKRNVKPILALGDRGIGKTWVVKEFCLKQFEKHQDDPWLVPPAIYLNLRVFSNQLYQQTSLFEAILFQLRKLYSIKMLNDYYVWEAFVKTGKVIIVLDGFDEMSQESNKESMTKHLWEVFNIIDKTSRVIITSRISHFNSHLSIYQNFAYTNYKRRNKTSELHELYTDIESKSRRYFNIWILKGMGNDEINNLSKKYSSSHISKLSIGVKKLNGITDNSKPFAIEHEIEILSSTPAFYSKLVEFLSFESLPLINLYKNCLLSAVINYNIETYRALKSIRQKHGNKIERISFNADTKLEILKELAWFMFERNQISFKLDNLPNYIKNIYGYDYDIIINDLRTQTIIKLKDDNEFEFLSEGIFSFLIASHLFNLIANEKSIDQGISDLGSHDILKHQSGKRILSFLSAYFEQNENLRTTLFKHLESKIDTDRPYSPWLRYIIPNLETIIPEISILKAQNSWTKKPLAFKENMVLIPGSENPKVEPFLISNTEVTNSQFLEFLNNKDIFKISTNEEMNAFGFHWTRKHNTKNVKSELPNPYTEIINDYHLLLWVKNELPLGKENHPVVYISWFAAAYFCNWLSLKRDLPIFYHFIIDEKDGKFDRVEFKKDNSGYRLPTEVEWEIAAREGNFNITHPWDKFLISPNELSEEGKKYKKKLLEPQSSTIEVRDERANIYGVYGLVGNVREWVDSNWSNIDKSKQEIGIKSDRPIKGATWLLEEDGFAFNHYNHVMAQNTNLDVGFRIARSLSSKDKNIVKDAYKSFIY